MTIPFRFYVLEKRVKTQVQRKRDVAITLKFATTNTCKRSATFIGDNIGFEIRVQIFNQNFDMIRNVTVIKNGLNQTVMNFT